jgi:hypothetical protein
MAIKSMRRNKVRSDGLEQINPSPEKISEYSKTLEKIINEP